MKVAGKVRGKHRTDLKRFEIEVLDNCALKVGDIITVTVKDKKRTLEQNSLLHLFLTRAATQIEHMTKDLLKEILKEKFLLVKVWVEILNREVTVIKSTAGLNKADFSEFIKKCDMELANEFGCDMTGFWTEYEKEYRKYF